MKIIHVAVLAMAPVMAAADELKPVSEPGDRSYPLAVLGIAPGMTADDAKAIIEGRGITLSPETMKLRVTSPEGNTFDLKWDGRLLTKGIGPMTRMGNDPYEEVRISLATGVLDGRVLAIHRTIRDSTDVLPEPAALRAQLTQTFGEPSEVDIGGSGGMVIYYAWGPDGQIADLANAPKQEIPMESGNGTQLFETCKSGGSGSAKYDFEYPRKTRVMPGCSALLKVSYSGGAATAKISFDLQDFDLIRENNAETDKQILAGLKKEVQASDIDL